MGPFEGKKLLIVSSDGADRALLKAGRELGLYIVCCDRYTDYTISPTKAMADEAWDLNYKQTDLVAKKCMEIGIDGVIAGYSEERVDAACKISKAIGRPFYATQEQLDLTRNKVFFKELCEKYGIPTPHNYKLSIPLVDEQVDAVRFPVIVKPSDAGGRKGITVCFDREQLAAAVELALNESIYKDVVVEQFIVGTEMSAIYTIVDGKASLSCLNDKYISDDEDTRGYLCSFVFTPSKYLKQYYDSVDPKVKEMLKSIGADNGVATFQMMACDDGIYIFEMGYRINGNNDYTVIEKENGLNYCHMLISYSLTGSMGDDISKDNPFFKQYHGTFVILLHAGKIAKIDDSALRGKKGIDDIYITKAVGNIVPDRATNVHKAGLIKFSSDTIEEAKRMVHFIQTHLVIEDENGNSMLFEEFDTSRLD